MGMFFGNYDKPGPGIRKDAPPQKAVPRFFSILQRKFFDLIKLNLLFCIPVAVVAALVLLLNVVFPYPIVDFLPVILLFPFIGGLTLVTRNYAREEHAFIFSDFKDAVKNNWAAFLSDGIICYAAYFILSIAVPYYWQNGSKNILSTIAAGICIAVALLFLFSQYYVPVQLVTFDLKFSQVLKNSLIFAVLGIGRNFLVTLLLAVLAFFLYISLIIPIMPLLTIIAVLLVIFLLFSYCSFLINFAVYPLINKMMIQPYKDKNKQDDDNSDDPSDFTDRLD